MFHLNGMPVQSNPLCVEHTLTPTWIDKVLQWNPCNRFQVTAIEKPTAYVANFGGRQMLIAHPSIIAELRNIT